MKDYKRFVTRCNLRSAVGADATSDRISKPGGFAMICLVGTRRWYNSTSAMEEAGEFRHLMHSDGRMSFDRGRPRRYQANSMPNLINKHKVGTVAFYDFDADNLDVEPLILTRPVARNLMPGAKMSCAKPEIEATGKAEHEDDPNRLQVTCRVVIVQPGRSPAKV